MIGSGRDRALWVDASNGLEKGQGEEPPVRWAEEIEVTIVPFRYTGWISPRAYFWELPAPICQGPDEPGRKIAFEHIIERNYKC